MKTSTTLTVAALHVVFFGMIMLQPSCKSSDDSINPDLTAPDQTSEAPVAVESARIAPEGSENLRAAPTRPVYALPNRGVNEVPADTFIQPEDELVAPSEASTVEPEPTIGPRQTNIGPRPIQPTILPTQSAGTSSYVVKKGDNLTKIAKAHDTTVNAIMEANSLPRNAVLTVGKTLTIPVSGTPSANVRALDSAVTTTHNSVYVVQKGDSLSKIAIKHNTSVAKIMAANGMNNANIRIGQKLNIPTTSATVATPPSSYSEPVRTSATSVPADAITHKVASGETLGGIALKYKVSVNSIMETNGISDPRKLRVGQTLVIKKNAADTSATQQTSSTIAPDSNSRVIQTPTTQQQPSTIAPSTVPSEAMTPAPTIIEDSVDL